MRCRERLRAFTLIELLVVIIIIAVMSAVAVPAYARFYARARFDSTVQSVQDIFAYAREQAIDTDTTVSLTFDQTSETFVVHVTPPPTPADLPVAFTTGNGSDPAEQPQEATRQTQVNSENMITGFTNSAISSSNDSSSNVPANPAAQPPTSPNEIRFNGDGTCDGAEFTIVNAGGYSKHIVVMQATGRAFAADDEAGR